MVQVLLTAIFKAQNYVFDLECFHVIIKVEIARASWPNNLFFLVSLGMGSINSGIVLQIAKIEDLPGLATKVLLSLSI